MQLAIAAVLSLSYLVRADDFFQFKSRRDIKAPKWKFNFLDDNAELQQGLYWFTAPYHSLEEKEHKDWTGPYIYDTAGELIWSGADHVGHVNTFDFRATQVAGGEPVLSYIWGESNEVGNGYILDNTYTVRHVVDMDWANGRKFRRYNMHEFNLIDGGKRALFIYDSDPEATQIWTPIYRGTCNLNWQGFQEVDVETGKVLFDWNAWDRIAPIEGTHMPDQIDWDLGFQWEEKCRGSWDFTHCDSVEKLPDGDYILSCRYTDTVYKISHKDQSIVWRLGGPANDFVFNDPSAKFLRQHHARYHSRNETHLLLSLLDNTVGRGRHEDDEYDSAWGKLLALRTDTEPMTVDLVSRFKEPKDRRRVPRVDVGGSLTYLPNGNAFLGWMAKSMISEHAPDGTLLMSASMDVKGSRSYRTYQQPWTGRPASPPDLYALVEPIDPEDAGLRTTVFVSWNGATEVAMWEILRTNEFGNLSIPVAWSPRSGFETRITFDEAAKHVVAVAFNAKGGELGRSNVTEVLIQQTLDTPTMDRAEEEWLASVVQASSAISGGTLLAILGVVAVCVVLCAFGCVLGLRWWKRWERTSTDPPPWSSRRKDESDEGLEESLLSRDTG